MGCRLVDVALPSLTAAFRGRHARQSLDAAAPYNSTAKYGAVKPNAGYFNHLNNFAKLRLWELPIAGRAVFLDADTIVLRNLDHLFDTRLPFMAACDHNCANLQNLDALNSGVFVTSPSPRTYDAMVERLRTDDRLWTRTDQTFLQTFFPEWNHLSWAYNAVQYLRLAPNAPFDVKRVYVVHYAMHKPWDPTPLPRESPALQPLHDLWWRFYRGEDVGDAPGGQAWPFHVSIVGQSEEQTLPFGCGTHAVDRWLIVDQDGSPHQRFVVG